MALGSGLLGGAAPTGIKRKRPLAETLVRDSICPGLTQQPWQWFAKRRPQKLPELYYIDPPGVKHLPWNVTTRRGDLSLRIICDILAYRRTWDVVTDRCFSGVVLRDNADSRLKYESAAATRRLFFFCAGLRNIYFCGINKEGGAMFFQVFGAVCFVVWVLCILFGFGFYFHLRRDGRGGGGVPPKPKVIKNNPATAPRGGRNSIIIIRASDVGYRKKEEKDGMGYWKTPELKKFFLISFLCPISYIRCPSYSHEALRL